MTRNGRTVLFSLAVIAVMVGLVAASVPLYSLFCRVTGYGGTPRVATGASPEVSRRTITVRFDASVARGMPWHFVPERTSTPVRLGETLLAVFKAENPTDETIVGTAAFNVTPAKAAPYVDKIACFCFSEQRLGPHQATDMPVSFFIDPKIAEDPETNDVGTITLSYTFFRTSRDSAVDRQKDGPS